MSFKHIKMVAICAVICAWPLNVIGSLAIFGKLRTRDNKPVMVNGTKAISGTTIMSGARIQCPAKVGATVDLGPLGRVEMAPGSDQTLVFDERGVTVELRTCYVVLTTKPGIVGIVNTADGEVFKTDPTKESSVLARARDCAGPETAALGASGGLGAVGWAGLGGIAAAVIAGTTTGSSGRGSDLSPDNPRVP